MAEEHNVDGFHGSGGDLQPALIHFLRGCAWVLSAMAGGAGMLALWGAWRGAPLLLHGLILLGLAACMARLTTPNA